MSASVLYLVIIAIWAIFLVPAWLRRGHAARDAAGDDAYDTEPGAHPEDAEESAPGEHEVAPPLAGRGDRPGDPVDFEEDDAIGWEEAPPGPVEHAPRYEVTFEDDYVPSDYYADDEAEPEPAPRPREPHGERAAEPIGAPSGYAAASEIPAAARKAQQAARESAHRTAERFAQAGRSPQSRQQMLRARRRMLSMLLALTAVMAAGTAMGLFPWWAAAPPAAMLLLDLLLLREVAIAEAETAARRRDAAARSQARSAPRRPVRQAPAYEHEERQERTAEVIDISSRVSDQLYDQYADAAVRAVGD